MLNKYTCLCGLLFTDGTKKWKCLLAYLVNTLQNDGNKQYIYGNLSGRKPICFCR